MEPVRQHGRQHHLSTLLFILRTLLMALSALALSACGEDDNTSTPEEPVELEVCGEPRPGMPRYLGVLGYIITPSGTPDEVLFLRLFITPVDAFADEKPAYEVLGHMQFLNNPPVTMEDWGYSHVGSLEWRSEIVYNALQDRFDSRFEGASHSCITFRDAAKPFSGKATPSQEPCNVWVSLLSTGGDIFVHWVNPEDDQDARLLLYLPGKCELVHSVFDPSAQSDPRNHVFQDLPWIPPPLVEMAGMSNQYIGLYSSFSLDNYRPSYASMNMWPKTWNLEDGLTEPESWELRMYTTYRNTPYPGIP